MPKVITEGSTIKCPHQGTVTFTASQHLLKVDGQAVLVVDDISSGTVSGCTNPTDRSKGSQTCTKVISMTNSAAVATKLKVGGKPVLLETAMGITDGLPANAWSVQSAGQTKLEVIP